jgi:hypothetical protein
VGGETPNLCGGDEVKNLSGSKNVASFFFVWYDFVLGKAQKISKPQNLKKNLDTIRVIHEVTLSLGLLSLPIPSFSGIPKVRTF